MERKLYNVRIGAQAINWVNDDMHDLDFNSAVRVGLFTVPGDGCIDYPSIMDVLEKNNYQGWLVVEAEQNALYFNPFEYARKSREYLKNIAGI